VYDAKVRMADIYEVLGDARRSKRLRAEASRLFERFNEAFWWEAEGTYYLGLDGQKRPIETVASNAGHCLASGIVPPERASRVVKRLMADDMWSGWGVRTLSSDHIAYNPFSYHTGSVWPHDNAMIAGGFRRYGHDDEAAKVAAACSTRSERFLANRLPELFAGLPRDEGSFPSSTWAQRAAGLGRRFDLPLIAVVRHPRDHGPSGSRLYVDPALRLTGYPLTIGNLRAGQRSGPIRSTAMRSSPSNTTGLRSSTRWRHDRRRGRRASGRVARS
jgi:hypothetical protein